MTEKGWLEIRKRYITENISYRKIAKEYGIPPETVSARGKKEEWVNLRKQHLNNIMSKALKADEKKHIKSSEKLYALAREVADKLYTVVSENELTDLAAIGIKPRDITGAIKDIEDALHIKSELDLQEQKAKIKALEKQATDDDENKEIKVSIEGFNSEWAK